MIKRLALLLMISGLGACSSTVLETEATVTCSEVAVYQYPPHTDNLYRVLLTQMDEQALLNQPVYVVEPGTYSFRLVELIDDPRLDVEPRQRGHKEINLELKPGVRYHLAAQFSPDDYQNPERYWQPILWRESEASCRETG